MGKIAKIETRIDDASCPILLFTTFDHVKTLILDGNFFALDGNGDPFVVRITDNYSIQPITFAVDTAFSRNHRVEPVEALCPTAKLIEQYEQSKNWGEFESGYVRLLRHRKERIKSWMSGLKKQHVYILCCWEDLSLGLRCHREIVYDFIIRSKALSGKVIPILFSGDMEYNHHEKYDNTCFINENNSMNDRPIMASSPF